MISYTVFCVALSALLGAVAPAASFKATIYAFAPGRTNPNAIHRPDSPLSRTPPSLVVVRGSTGEDGEKSEKTADDDFLGGDGEYEGSVDWDEEWKKVVKNKDQPEKRPGNYKSQAEIAAIKTTNKVAKNVYDASRDLKESMPRAPSLPNIRSLSGDWKFWIGMIAIVSFGFAIISVSGQTTIVNDSFYI